MTGSRGNYDKRALLMFYYLQNGFSLQLLNAGNEVEVKNVMPFRKKFPGSCTDS